MNHTTITTDQELADFCTELGSCDWIAFDTEFISEGAYRPHLCLVQVATERHLTLIDSTTVEDMNPFWETLAEGDHETIVHAGRSEVEFSLRAIRKAPARLFDVQIASAFVGIEYPAGLRTLLYRVVGETAKKQETRSDWRRRPLSSRQIEYALADVLHLKAMRDKLVDQLTNLERLAWFEEEMLTWQEEVEYSVFRERWRRTSGIASLDRTSLAVTRELWRWRETVAERRNCPVRRVLRDDLIVELAKRKSADVKRIKAIRGLDRGDLKRQIGDMADAIQRALDLPERDLPHTRPRENTPQLAVLGQFLFAALGSICREANLAPSIVGSPSDVRELIAYRTGQLKRDNPPKLETGWRAKIAGNTFDDLLDGKVAIRVVNAKSDHPLAFDRIE